MDVRDIEGAIKTVRHYRIFPISSRFGQAGYRTAMPVAAASNHNGCHRFQPGSRRHVYNHD